MRTLHPLNDPFFIPPAKDVLQIYNGKTGEHIKDMPLPKVVRVSRRKMREFCAQGIDVRYGKAFADITYDSDGKGETATFHDKTTASGDILVGTDGSRSMVRGFLLGSEEAMVKPVGIVLSNIEVKYNDAEKSLFTRKYHPIYYMALHPDGVFSWISIQDVPDPDRPETWTFQFICSWLGDHDRDLDDAGCLSELKKIHENFAEPFRSANLWIPEGTPMSNNTIHYWIAKPWDNHEGRVVLAGDAAHPLPPHASNLVAAITKVHTREQALAGAISEYCDEVVKRGADEVTTSRDNALMLHQWDKVLESPLMKDAAPNAERVGEAARAYYGESGREKG
ncbi:hypothetical protein FGG08_002254 [Glutinoglossum americanum]|uniref:FAD-binding domain-containing protein n=1 Tax=Glutinoglossum americanum TaxID=1670608 RepID=A0A9P8L1V0_9PEZI|nr:hypothetical protein FGG08_002254 [Glutinoglossum americanum]